MLGSSANPSGRRILVVEDTLLIAELLAEELESIGCTVVGPIARLKPALACAADQELDGALLDVNLAGEMCFPIADILAERGVPFVFITGYDAQGVIPARFRDAQKLNKPFDPSMLANLIANLG